MHARAFLKRRRKLAMEVTSATGKESVVLDVCMLEFIRQKGYEEFLKRANKWKGPHRKLEIATLP